MARAKRIDRPANVPFKPPTGISAPAQWTAQSGGLTKSIGHYRDALGFTVTFQYGEPTFHACLCRDEVALHLLAAHETKRLPGNGGICVFVKDVDGVHAELAARGAKVIKPPQNYDYGMRDFDVIDLDGNHLTFGMESRSPS